MYDRRMKKEPFYHRKVVKITLFGVTLVALQAAGIIKADASTLADQQQTEQSPGVIEAPKLVDVTPSENSTPEFALFSPDARTETTKNPPENEDLTVVEPGIGEEKLTNEMTDETSLAAASSAAEIAAFDLELLNEEPENLQDFEPPPATDDWTLEHEAKLHADIEKYLLDYELYHVKLDEFNAKKDQLESGRDSFEYHEIEALLLILEEDYQAILGDYEVLHQTHSDLTELTDLRDAYFESDDITKWILAHMGYDYDGSQPYKVDYSVENMGEWRRIIKDNTGEYNWSEKDWADIFDMRIYPEGEEEKGIPTFCAYLGSQHFAGEGSSGSHYLLDVNPFDNDFASMGGRDLTQEQYDNIVSAYNYIYDQFGQLDGDTRVVTQIVTWMLLDEQFTFNSFRSEWEHVVNMEMRCGLQEDEAERTLATLLAVAGGYQGHGNIYAFLYLVAVNEDGVTLTDPLQAQPQIVPIFRKDVPVVSTFEAPVTAPDMPRLLGGVGLGSGNSVGSSDSEDDDSVGTYDAWTLGNSPEIEDFQTVEDSLETENSSAPEDSAETLTTFKVVTASGMPTTTERPVTFEVLATPGKLTKSGTSAALKDGGASESLTALSKNYTADVVSQQTFSWTKATDKTKTKTKISSTALPETALSLASSNKNEAAQSLNDNVKRELIAGSSLLAAAALALSIYRKKRLKG